MRGKRIRKEKPFSNVPQVEVDSDEELFVPVTENGTTYVRCNVPINVTGTRSIPLSYRNCCHVDCGFSVKVPDGFRLVVELLPEFKDRGIDAYGNLIIGESRVSVMLRNLGKEIVTINHGVRFAHLRIEPNYLLKIKVN